MILKAPLDRFENLEGYDFQPNYLEVEAGLQMHYLDEGDKSKPVILLLHGEPSWSYLYRKMIPKLSTHFRVIAPDLIGFGKSDKFTEKSDYTYQKHLSWVSQLVKELALTEITLFCQDWGGLLGLRMVAENPDLFSHVVAANTFLPTGEREMPESFIKWREFSQKHPAFDIGRVIDMGTSKDLSDEVLRAYNAPFPDEEYKAAARIFPMLVPAEADDPESLKNKEAWKSLMKFEKPFLTIFGDEDYIMKGAEKVFQKLVPGARGQNHKIINAAHFIQEDQGELLADLAIEFYKSN